MSVKSYYKTFLISILLVLCITVCLVAFQYVSKSNRYEKLLLIEGYDDKAALEYKAYGLLVDKYTYLIKKEPKNYKILLKLAKVYELQGETNNAIKYYEQAISLSDSLAYEPIFNLAHCYLRSGEYTKAQNVVDRIETNGLRELKLAKAEFFKAYADDVFKTGQLEKALELYKTASQYYKESGIKTYPQDFIDAASKALNLAADKCIERADTKGAIEYLNVASVFLDDAVAYYKLGLLYIDVDLEKALKYVDMAFRRKPDVINFDVYEKLVATLIDRSVATKKTVAVKNYSDKLKLIKDYRLHNFINPNDVLIKLDKGPIYYDQETLAENIRFKVLVKNMTKKDIDRLYLTFLLKTDNTNLAKYQIQIVNNNEPLSPHAGFMTLDVKLPVVPLMICLAKLATIEVYGARNRNVQPILLAQFNIIK